MSGFQMFAEFSFYGWIIGLIMYLTGFWTGFGPREAERFWKRASKG